MTETNKQTGWKTETHYDRYNRIEVINQKIDYTTHTLEYTYQSVNESPSVAKVKTIKDGIEDGTHTFDYDDKNEPKSYHFKTRIGDKAVSVSKLSDTETEHKINTETYKTTIKKDNDNLFSPRTKGCNITLNDSATKFSYTYDYDTFGRLKHKYNSSVNTEIVYERYKNRIQEIKTNVDRKYSYSYLNDNLFEIYEKNSANNVTFSASQYEYDSLSR